MIHTELAKVIVGVNDLVAGLGPIVKALARLKRHEEDRGGELPPLIDTLDAGDDVKDKILTMGRDWFKERGIPLSE